jgi:hypothetical protein
MSFEYFSFVPVELEICTPYTHSLISPLFIWLRRPASAATPLQRRVTHPVLACIRSPSRSALPPDLIPSITFQALSFFPCLLRTSSRFLLTSFPDFVERLRFEHPNTYPNVNATPSNWPLTHVSSYQKRFAEGPRQSSQGNASPRGFVALRHHHHRGVWNEGDMPRAEDREEDGGEESSFSLP